MITLLSIPILFAIFIGGITVGWWIFRQDVAAFWTAAAMTLGAGYAIEGLA